MDLRNLAASFGDRYQRLAEPQDLEAALQNYQRSIDLTPDGDPRLPDRLGGLFVALMDRHKRFSRNSPAAANLQY
ncbi:hypothetical protein K438DRAFT_1815117 [Mycena galopus ATCC 62051]|nr:hypothetical protein K438DRAFT_1815117 [Mycena galopus ATCC 62051]